MMLKVRIKKFLRGIDRIMSMKGCCRATPWGIYGPEKFNEYIKHKEQELNKNY